MPSQNHGLKQFYYGLSDEILQARRGHILATTKSQLIDATQKYIMKASKLSHSSKVIFGSESNNLDKLEEEGYRVEKVSEGLSLRRKLYEDKTGEGSDF